MTTKPFPVLVGLVLAAGAALATPVSKEPLKAFQYQPASSSPALANPAPIKAPPPRVWTVPAGSALTSNYGPQISDREMRDLQTHVTAPRSPMPHGLYIHELPDGEQITALGPFAPTIPGDPHADQARFTLVGLSW